MAASISRKEEGDIWAKTSSKDQKITVGSDDSWTEVSVELRDGVATIIVKNTETHEIIGQPVVIR